MLMTALFASLAAAGSRYLSSYLAIHVIVCGQYITGLILISPIMFKRGSKGLVTERWRLHLLRGVSGVAALYAFYFSLSHIQLVEATLLRNASPLCVPVIIQVWLGIKIPHRRWRPLIFGFIGVMVILRPIPGSISFWHFSAFISAILVGMTMVATRLLVYTESNTTVVFYYYLIAVLASLLPALKSLGPAPIHVWAMLFGSGLCLHLAMSCYTMAFRYAKPSVISPISFFGVVFAGGWGWLFWGQIPVIWTYIGITLVAAGAVMVIRQEGVEAELTSVTAG